MLARTVGVNCGSAMIFDDEAFARSTLASLAAVPHVRSATLYRKDGSSFAAYLRPRVAADDQDHSRTWVSLLLRDATAAGDAVAFAAHSVKSDSANLGATDLAASLQALETATKAGDLGRADTMVGTIAAMHATVREYLAGQPEAPVAAPTS